MLTEMRRSENKGFNELSKDNKGFNIQDEIKLDNYTDIYAPWQTKKRLRIWYEVEWTVWWGGWVFQKTYQIASPSSTFDLTWCPFNPKSMNVRWYLFSSTSWCDGMKTDSEEVVLWGDNTNTSASLWSTIYIYSWSVRIDATFNSWISWWVRLNAVTSTASNIFLIVTFYS